MVAEGADLLDIGGESTRPGHAAVDAAEDGARRPDVAAVRAALPAMPLSIDTTKPAVAEAALDAGADLINDVWGVTPTTRSPGSPRSRRADRPHAQPRRAALRRRRGRGRRGPARAIDVRSPPACAAERLIVDPGIGFGKTPEQNLALLRELGGLRVLGRPILLGTSRKSTIGQVLDLPAEERLEGTLATTALGIANGADIVRVHDVRANVRAARMADAIVRGWRPDGLQEGAR